MEIFAYAFLIMTIFILIFQLSLIFGAPLAEYTLGGRYNGKLPIKMRFVAFVQIIILLVFAAIILSKAGIAFDFLNNISKIGSWVVFAFFIFGTFANFTSRSKKERIVMGPLNLIFLLCSFIIAIS